MNEQSAKENRYEQTHRLRSLLLVTTIVSEGQSEAIVAINNRHEAALVFVCFGKGTAPVEAFLAHHISSKREVVFSVLRAEKWPEYKEALRQRFSISKLSKGVAYAVPIDAVAGVSIYKMLSNTRLFEKPIIPGKEKKRRIKKK